MTIGNRIADYRKKLGITQEGLAQKLNVSNQAVSKWESDQCCPDIQLLPMLADIFHISIDALFGRQSVPPVQSCSLPWHDDGAFRAVLFLGHQLVEHSDPHAKEIRFTYEGPAHTIISAFAVSCGDVQGNVDAGSSVNCRNVGGNVDAGGAINCGNVGGDADAGSSITCGNIGGDADAGNNITCAEVHGDVDAGGSVQCTQVDGDVDAGGRVIIGK